MHHTLFARTLLHCVVGPARLYHTRVIIPFLRFRIHCFRVLKVFFYRQGCYATTFVPPISVVESLNNKFTMFAIF